MDLIEANHLSKIYDDGQVRTQALHDASFTISAGEFVALMGPSGSGKSTLLHILGFLDYPTSGTYAFDGKTITDYRPSELAHVRNKKMGFVFQAFNLLPRTNVYDNVMLPLLYSRTPRRQRDGLIQAAIEAVGLTSRTKHRPDQLSGGERQRLAIARALVNQPELIFADEPTGNLDSKSAGTVMAILQRLHREQGRTIILITHNDAVAHYAQRIIMIHDGQVTSDQPIASHLASEHPAVPAATL